MPERSNSEPDLLDLPVSRYAIEELSAAGLLSPQARDAAMLAERQARQWWLWANRCLLFIGATLVLAGIVFFFAYNWARMSSVAKLCLIEAGLWLCALGAMQRGLDRLTGKVLLLAASMLVGILLAVYGQVYQTGADDWKIYALWAFLILPWTIAGGFHALWILWLVVTNAAWLLFWFQMQPPTGFQLVFGICLLLGVWNSLALILREKWMQVESEWTAGRWGRHLIWFAVLVLWLIPTLNLVVETEFGNGSLVGAIGFGIVLVVGHHYFRYREPDLTCLGYNVLAAAITLLTLIGRLLFDASAGAGAFLLFGLIALGVSSSAAFYLRGLWRAMGDDED